ncbi:ABC transporter permease [Kocuria sp. JC486]|uniref:FtsX-like permease family protein n=1 Tax=Kocuria sp. JC486 TaxID=1970736 RepID=UPI001420D6AD|nr:ABC transporter permease [Kocuria sp. JC486]NHU85505.1 ABC transporter permease [Kocuria sp. JC486]
MRRIVLSRLRLQWARYVLIALCVAVSAAFASAAFILNSTLNASMVGTLTAMTKNSDLVVSVAMPEGGGSMEASEGLTVEDVNALTEIDGVQTAWSQTMVAAQIEGKNPADAPMYAAPAPTDGAIFPWEFTEGRMAQDSGEVVVTADLAERGGLSIDRTVPVTAAMQGPGAPLTGTDRATPTATELRVVGIVDAPEMEASINTWVTEDQLADMVPGGVDSLPTSFDTQLLLSPGADLEHVRDQVTTQLEDTGVDVDVQTPQELSDQQLEAMSGDSNIMLAFLMAFALLAAIVAFLVITTTFGVLTAQRARELALLRCMGATGAQLRRGVVMEAVAIGVISSVLGVAAVTGLAFALSPLLPNWVVVAVSPRDLAIGIALGVVITLLASLGPARRAMQASPLDGMRGSRSDNRLPVVRTALGVVLLLAGASVLVWAAMVHNQPLAGIGAGAAAGLGLILTSRLWMPTVVTVLGRLLPGGTPSALASANASRHPARTTTTATALLIGITLVATVLTGHAVAQKSVLEHLEQTRPVDVTISRNLDAAAVEKISALDDVEGVTQGAGETTVDLARGIGSRPTQTALGDIAEITDTNAFEIGAAAFEKASYVDILNIMLAVALGLLGAAVLVSVLGIASTMSLSVLERTRENSLLRALGLSRRQLGATIRREAIVIAAAACAVGIVAGWLLGTAVISAMVTETIPVLLTAPWWGLVAVVLGAWLTALIAAALPARRATKVSPVAGLAAIE